MIILLTLSFVKTLLMNIFLHLIVLTHLSPSIMVLIRSCNVVVNNPPLLL